MQVTFLLTVLVTEVTATAELNLFQQRGDRPLC